MAPSGLLAFVQRYGIVGSIAIHVALGLVIVSIKPRPPKQKIIVTIAEQKKPPAKPPAPPPPPKLDEPPPPPKAPDPPKAARPAAPPKSAAPPPPPSAAPPPAAPTTAAAASDFGLSLSGATGGNGVSVPAGGGGGGNAEPQAARDKTDRAPRPQKKAECEEPLAKARPVDVPEPAYPESAREAGVEGKVRVELRLDEKGAVVEARVLASLSPELDEAAIAAAKRAQFEPATQCGKAVASVFVMSIRFAL